MLWGADIGLVYESIDSIAGLPDGSAVLDIPCGGGVAFRGIGPDQKIRYVAADISPGMLRRARRVAAERGLEQIEFVEADVEALPFDSASFDLCLCLNSLHCFADAATGLAEIARCLRPGARLVCDCAVVGEGRRFDRLYELYRRRGIFGPGGTVADLRRWLENAGFERERLEVSGAIAFVEARKPS